MTRAGARGDEEDRHQHGTDCASFARRCWMGIGNTIACRRYGAGEQ